nr:unnamed protein product [Spirometra erinaceieuropaei]
MAFRKATGLAPAVKYFRSPIALNDLFINRRILSQLNLKPVKSIEFTFNPFFSRTFSVRNVCSLLNSPRWRSSNENCLMKVTVRSDMTEPQIQVNFVAGDTLIIKTENLSDREALEVRWPTVLSQLLLKTSTLPHFTLRTSDSSSPPLLKGDSISCSAYRNFVQLNADELFAGKTVLHLAAGPGLLTMFLASARPKRIFAVEASKDLAMAIRQVAASNGLEECVEVLEGKANDLQRSSRSEPDSELSDDSLAKLKAGKVDVIFCDWMGPLLFYRSNLPAVMEAARSHLRRPGGRIYPRHAVLCITGLECSQHLLNAYCLDTSAVSPLLQSTLSALRRPICRLAYLLDVSAEVAAGRARVLARPVAATSAYGGTPAARIEVDLLSLPSDGSALASLPSAHDFCLLIDGPRDGRDCQLDALVAYFDCRMDDDAEFNVTCLAFPTRSNGHEECVEILEGKANDLQRSSRSEPDSELSDDSLAKLKAGKVDVIFCDWMGPLLFYRSNLPAVMEAARSHLRRPGGRIYPRHAVLCITGLECSQHLLNAYCLDTPTAAAAAVSPLLQSTLSALRRPICRLAYLLDVSAEVAAGRARVLARPVAATAAYGGAPAARIEVDLLSLPSDGSALGSLPSAHDFCLLIDGPRDGRDCQLDALVAYFDCRMDDDAEFNVTFSTSPSAKSTHYAQTIFFLEHPLPVSSGDRETLGDLTAEDFDHKKWINKAMKSVGATENPEASLTSLVLNLQAALDRANLDVENTFQEVAQSTPRFMREMESVRRNVLLLKDHMAGIQTDFRKMHIDSSETISRLTELDRQRERTKLAADALREASRWSTLVNSRKVLMEGDNVEQLYQLILDMEQSIAYMESIPDFEDRLALLNSTKDRLEALVAPQFMELLDAHGVSTDTEDVTRLDALRRLISIFVAVRRSDVAVRYYTSWFSGRLKSLWDLPCVPTSPDDSSDIRLSSTDASKPASVVRRIVDFFQSVIQQLDDQLRLQLFPDAAPLPLLRGFVAALPDVSAEVSKVLNGYQASSRTDYALELSREYLEAVYNFGTSLCAHLVSTEKGTSPECCTLLFDISRSLLTPLAHMAELYGAHAKRQLTQLLQSSTLTSLAEQSSLLTEVQHSSRASISLADKLLKSCIRETRGVALPLVISAIEDYFEELSAKWVNAFEAAGSNLIEEDKRAGYAQASGLSSVLTLVSATGSHALALDAFIGQIRSASRAIFEWPSTPKKDGCALFSSTTQAQTEEARCFCPFHDLFVPLLGETQSGTVTTAAAANAVSPWSALCALSPGISSLLRSPSLGCVTLTAPATASANSQLSRLRRVATAVCQGSVSMAIRVAMAPVNDLLSQVPRLAIWSASPGSGEATLPDLAYLPQEYVTQLGQYIFNLPELLLPFMESAPDLEQPSAENSRGLAECLQRGSPDSFGVGSDSARSRHRSTASLSPPASPLLPQSPEHAHVIADWLDWLLSGQVSKAFITAILRIQATSNAGEAAVLTQHGAKQLDADIGYLLGLLEELSLPTPADLLCLRELINCPAASFSEFSRGKPVALLNKRYIRQSTWNKDPIPLLRTVEGTEISYDKDNAEYVSQFFRFVVTSEPDIFSPTCEDEETPTLEADFFTETVVQKELLDLEESTSFGPDAIPAKLLNELAPEMSKSLAWIFQTSLDTGCLPSDWKSATISPFLRVEVVRLRITTDQ